MLKPERNSRTGLQAVMRVRCPDRRVAAGILPDSMTQEGSGQTDGAQLSPGAGQGGDDGSDQGQTDDGQAEGQDPAEQQAGTTDGQDQPGQESKENNPGAGSGPAKQEADERLNNSLIIAGDRVMMPTGAYNLKSFGGILAEFATIMPELNLYSITGPTSAAFYASKSTAQAAMIRVRLKAS